MPKNQLMQLMQLMSFPWLIRTTSIRPLPAGTRSSSLLLPSSGEEWPGRWPFYPSAPPGLR